MRVREIMNQAPGSISPDANLSEALKTMAQLKIRHLVVVEEGRQVVGILSDRDLAMYYDPEGMTEERWQKALVRNLMSGEPVTIGSTAEVREAARLLLREAVSALPVVDSGTLVGIISDRDFTRYFAMERGE